MSSLLIFMKSIRLPVKAEQDQPCALQPIAGANLDSGFGAAGMSRSEGDHMVLVRSLCDFFSFHICSLVFLQFRNFSRRGPGSRAALSGLVGEIT